MFCVCICVFLFSGKKVVELIRSAKESVNTLALCEGKTLGAFE